MRLAVDLAVRVMLVTGLCLSAATAWVMLDAVAGTRAEMQASAERVARESRSDTWHVLLTVGPGRSGQTASSGALPERWLRLVGSGVCVGVASVDGVASPEARTLCGAWGGVGPAAPAWFEASYTRLFGREDPISRVVLVNGRPTSVVTARPDADANVRQVWHRLHTSFGIAAAMAAGIAACVVWVVARALRPARIIVASLDRIDRGAGSLPEKELPRFRTVEFDRIAQAVNDLGRRLADAAAERAALMRRLFAVQEEERRVVARDLHDEFGQYLTATEALAAAIETGADDRPELAADARAISDANRRMMEVLRSALAHLRPPDLSEIGLRAGLNRLVTGRGRNGTVYRIEAHGDIDGIAPHLALTLYRVAQEGLTNALRHGRPANVRVRAERERDTVRLSVEDDGGGDPRDAAAKGGHGLAGLRERLVAHGGRLDVGRAARGLRLVAVLPLDPAWSVGAAA